MESHCIGLNITRPSPFLSAALMKVLFWLLHPDPRSRATLKDLQKDKWTNQEVDMSGYTFEAVLGKHGHGSFHNNIVTYVCMKNLFSHLSNITHTTFMTDFTLV